MSKISITPEQARAELATRHARAFNIEKILFRAQLDFIRDGEPFKTAVCSRRAGKSVSCAVDLLDTALRNPGTVCLYVTLSRNNAKKLVWKELKGFNRQYGLGAKVDNTELSLTLPNDAIIYCSGAKDASEIEKFRGLALKKVYIDECQSFRAYLQDLIDDVLMPALMDHDGSLVLIGTPGPVPSGYFYDCSTSASWSHHAWTFFDNPHMVKGTQTHMQKLQRVLEARGVSLDNPSIQREYFGRWETDLDSLLLKYEPAKCHYTELPKDLIYIMGIDLGYVDADAIAILGWSETSKVVWLVEEHLQSKAGLSELVVAIKRLEAKYKPGKLMIDEGGLGKKLAEEMRRQYHIPVQAADKARKMENVAFLNTAMATERFKAKRDSKFAQDCALVEIDYDKSTPDRIKVKDSYHSDIIDAVLYAFKESPAFAYEAPLAPPAPGTAGYYKKIEDDMEEAAEAYFGELAAQEAEASNDPYSY